MTTPVWLKPAVVGVAVGGIAVAILGFSVGGWVTASKAEEMARSLASAEVVAAQLPYCVDAAKRDPSSAAALQKMMDISSYQRSRVVIENGWATAPGSESADNTLATRCAQALVAAMSK